MRASGRGLVLLDNEAVQALRDAEHPKHRKVIAQLQDVAHRKRRAVQVAVAVPTTVRVEAGWDRTSASWALANRLGIADKILDPSQADIAAKIRNDTGVSVADAHLGAAIRTTEADNVAVLTSDPGDMAPVAGHRAVSVVTI